MVFLYYLVIIYMINLQTIVNCVLIELMFITFGLSDNNVT